MQRLYRFNYHAHGGLYIPKNSGSTLSSIWNTDWNIQRKFHLFQIQEQMHGKSLGRGFLIIAHSRFLVEFMYAKGLVLIYPNFYNQTSFSTNYYEEGIHSVPEGMEPKVPDYLRENSDDRFQVPLFQKKDAAFVFSELPQTIVERDQLNVPIISLHFYTNLTPPDLIRLSHEWRALVKRANPKIYKLFVEL
jgi:hypothetical protein